MKKEMTVKEIKKYQKNNLIKTQTYGKYGTLKKKYLEEHRPDIFWTLGKDLSHYLKEIDRQAEKMYQELYEEFSKNQGKQTTTTYLEKLKIEQEIKDKIEEIILSELIYNEESKQ